MDTISHVLTGLFIGIAVGGLLGFKDLKLPAFAGVLGGLAPDFDLVSLLMGGTSFFKYHRVVTHSIFAPFVFAFIIGAVFSKFKFQKKDFFKSDFSKYYLLGFAAVFSHLFLDFVTSQGIVLFYPFSNQLMSWSVMPLVDILLLIIFVSGLVVMELLPQKKVKVSALVLIFIACLFTAKFGLYEIAGNTVHELDGYEHATLMPDYFNPFEWRVVIETEQSFQVSDYSLFNGLKNDFEFEKQFNDLIAFSKASKLVDKFIETSRYPVAVVNENTVKWFDLRVSNDGHMGYTAMVTLDENLEVSEERMGL